MTSDENATPASAWVRWLPALVISAAIVAGAIGACGTAADLVLPPSDEEKLGDKVESQFLDTGVQVYDAGTPVRDYVQRLGQKAVRAAGEESPSAIEYEFGVVDDPETVNAFAMPGGQIYFYSGLLKLAETEAEVMAVMSHEVAHVTQRHIAKRLAAQYGMQAVVNAALGENPGLVAQLGTALAAKGTMLSYSRRHEREADRVGMEYMIEAGYDPQGFIDFFQTLKQLRDEQGIKLPVMLSSHPNPGDRIESARNQIGDRTFEDATVGRAAHQQVLQAIQRRNGGVDAGRRRDVADRSDAGDTAR